MIAFASHLDEFVVRTVGDLRFGAATAFFVVVSAWWVKGVLLVAIGGFGDVCKRRLPTTAVWAGMAAGAAAVAAALIKDTVERLRPPLADPSFAAAVPVPGGYSFPSGHAATAFAAAVAVGLCHPRLRLPVLAIALLVAFSRVYLGVHFPTDVTAGAILGALIGALCVFGGRALIAIPRLRGVRVA